VWQECFVRVDKGEVVRFDATFDDPVEEIAGLVELLLVFGGEGVEVSRLSF
jgi:hypothetical protein